jgi:hypothetical protein
MRMVTIDKRSSVRRVSVEEGARTGLNRNLLRLQAAEGSALRERAWAALVGKHAS